MKIKGGHKIKNKKNTEMKRKIHSIQVEIMKSLCHFVSYTSLLILF